MSGGKRLRWSRRRRNRDRWAVLGYLTQFGQAYVLDIWNTAAVSSGSIYVALRTLEAEGWVVRTLERDSGRTIYSITPPVPVPADLEPSVGEEL